MLESVRFTQLRVIWKNLLCGGEPIHNWHSDVHQDKVVNNLATTLSQIEFNLVVRLESVESGVCLYLELTLKYFLERIDIELAIVHNQDSCFTLAGDLYKVLIRWRGCIIWVLDVGVWLVTKAASRPPSRHQFNLVFIELEGTRLELDSHSIDNEGRLNIFLKEFFTLNIFKWSSFLNFGLFFRRGTFSFLFL